jgi:hypothetical protein
MDHALGKMKPVSVNPEAVQRIVDYQKMHKMAERNARVQEATLGTFIQGVAMGLGVDLNNMVFDRTKGAFVDKSEAGPDVLEVGNNGRNNA